ncbi:MAG: pilus assembly protein N-terminal domain-containing protein [Xanthobacteraceae bacterium]|nr:pilus assembly protein N-terminal domain-containing protein [Xanthobacteraceae bacterium]
MTKFALRYVLAIACFLALGMTPRPLAAETVSVILDQAKILRLPERVASIVIGNPAVADGTLQTGGLLVVTGKSYGTTNIIALDARGAVLAEHTFKVAAPRDGTVTVFRGVARETWSCAPRCERSVVLGDAPEYFDAAINQSGTRNGLASGQGPAAK